jgi:hypothetical protein
MAGINKDYAAAIAAADRATTPEQARESAHDLNYRIRSHAYTDNAAHAINFKFSKYSYGVGGAGVGGFSNFARTQASVSLPLPANIQDSFSVQVGAFEMGAMGALAADALSGGDIADNAVKGFRTALGNTEGNQESLATAVSTLQAGAGFFARNALDSLGFGNVSGGVSVASGDAVNPHVALKFDGVDMKSHTFTWNLAPKNKKESDELANCIAAIKKAMLPSYGLGGQGAVGKALLAYPDIVEISFTGLDQYYYYKFKKCMIKSFNVNYTPNGPAVLEGGRPAAVQLELSVTEAEIHTKEDYI